VQPLPGTEQATYPFWSPDSRSVAFFAAGKLKKIQVGAGAPNVLCDAPNGRGGTWSADNIVLFAPSTTGPLLRVDAAGGSPAPATTLDDSRGETTHRWPSFLPDGRHFLYAAVSGGQRPSETRVGSLDSREVTSLFAGDSLTTYASGHLFFWRDGGVMAQPFDPGARRLSGDPASVATPVGQGVGVGYVSFSASQTGVLVYSRGISRPISQPTWKDRVGRLISTASEPGDYLNIALAPDERRAAVALTTGTPENRDLWLIDFTRSGRVRLTSDPASETLPVWSPDGTRIIFGAVKAGAYGLYVMKADGSGSEELLSKFDEQSNPLDWSRDGRFLLYYNQSPKTGWDLWALPLTGDKKPFPFLQTAFNEDNGTFAPDTKWIAYVSNESSRDEVYVQPFPPTGAKYRVSSNGGTYPTWRGDGRELFFLQPDGTMMAAPIKVGSGIEPGIPQALFPSGIPLLGNRHQYAVTKDGQRFLLIVPQGRSTPTPLTVVVNWQANSR
jgi:Tol biopolymer transport system component